MQSSTERFLEISAISTKVYATSSVTLFCIVSFAIANQFRNIATQVKQNLNLFDNTAEMLVRLQSQYSSGKTINHVLYSTLVFMFFISWTQFIQFVALLSTLTTASAWSFLSKFHSTFSVLLVQLWNSSSTKAKFRGKWAFSWPFLGIILLIYSLFAFAQKIFAIKYLWSPNTFTPYTEHSQQLK